MNIKIQLMLYSIEGIILLFFIINEKKHLINSPIIILVLGTIFILLGIIIFCWKSIASFYRMNDCVISMNRNGAHVWYLF